MRLTLEFAGGLETLTSPQGKSHAVDVPTESTGAMDVKALLRWLGAAEGLLRRSPELMLQGDSVRPGVLVLVNETDWELTGGVDTELSEGDTVVFISTLHGG